MSGTEQKSFLKKRIALGGRSELARLRAAVDGAQTAIMMVDRNFVITYANQKTKDLLTENAATFRENWPSFDPEKIIGQCIDQFHKDPSHQRKLLQDPSKLPHKADITVGPLRFELTVSAQLDFRNRYIGNTLEWADVTKLRQQEEQNADYRGQIEAINRAQAVISFDLDGTITCANENFLGAMGYSIEEVVGQHHRMFVEPDYAKSPEYAEFWAKLVRGEYQSAEFKRLGKDGKEIWIQATYNPIRDLSGKPFKVVKFATDVTAQVLARQESERVGKIVDENLDKIVTAVGGANSQASSIATASAEALSTVQSVAAAVEQFQASSNEIAQSMAASKSEVEKAMNQTENADQSTQQLTSAAEAMNSIVEAIQGIAGQINLLALNATIESARAGEAGKGFAVVASEVKSLANQVSTATEQISNEINSMQAVAGDVVERLTDIKGAVQSVESSVASVAGAVEEQSTTTQEINSSMQSTTSAVGNINSNLESISTAIQDADRYANEGTELYRSLQKKSA